MKTLIITSDVSAAQAVTWDGLGKIDLGMIVLKSGFLVVGLALFAILIKGVA